MEELIDLFKQADVKSGSLSTKQGDVTDILDQIIGKRVYRIAGPPSANYIQIPKAKSPFKPFDSRKRFAYIQFKPADSRPFFFYFDLFIFPNDLKVKLSFSNQFKGNKATRSELQFPVRMNDKWTVIVVDFESIAKTQFGAKADYILQSMTLCSNMRVKGVYLSDSLYDLKNIPRTLAALLSCTSNLGALYNWVKIPANNRESLPAVAEVNKEQFLDDSFDINQEDMLVKEESKFSIRDPSFTIEENSKSKIKESFGPEEFSLNSSKQQSSKKVKFEGVKAEDSPIKRDTEPPLFALEFVIGFSGTQRSIVKWTRESTNLTAYAPELTENSDKFLLYPSGCTLIMMNPFNKKQHCFFGHTAPINSLFISQDGSLVVTGQEGPSPLVLLWELKMKRAPSTLSISSAKALKCLALSNDNTYLATATHDNKARDIITVWDVATLEDADPPGIKTKHVSNFQINSLKFLPAEPDRLVSCGVENIRFWRVNKEHLSGTCIVLNQHAHGAEYLDIEFEGLRVFVTSSRGLLFQINSETLDIEGAYQLHDGPINSLVANSQICVTASSDNFIRVWQLDFSDYLLEVPHEDGGIMSVDISHDGAMIACGAKNSSLVILNMATNGLKILLRSHTAPVLALDVHPNEQWVLTAAADNTIRLWNTTTFDEIHEFSSPEDKPTSLSFNPQMSNFACGFESGAVQIFENQGEQAQYWYQQHETPVAKVLHSNDGKLLLSISEDALVCAYDVFRKYSPVKCVSPEVKGQYVDVSISPDSKQFAVLGTHSSTIFIWDVATFALKFRINTSGAVIQKILFSPNGQDLLAISAGMDYKVRFYGLNGFEAVPIKEFSGLHTGAEIRALAISPNAKYVVTGSSDRIIKVWDYAGKPSTMNSQGFLGHPDRISSVHFSASSDYMFSFDEGHNGIFVWKFFGDTSALDIPPPRQESQNVKIIEEESYEDLLETVQRLPRRTASPIDIPMHEPAAKPVTRKEPSYDFQKSPLKIAVGSKMDLVRVVGYNSEIEENVVWAFEEGWYMYVSGNLVVQNLLRENSQSFFTAPCERVAKIAVSPDKKILAAVGVLGESFAIFVWDISTRGSLRELMLHTEDVRVLEFSQCGQ